MVLRSRILGLNPRSSAIQASGNNPKKDPLFFCARCGTGWKGLDWIRRASIRETDDEGKHEGAPKSTPPHGAVLAVGLEPIQLGGRSVTPLGSSATPTRTPEQEGAPCLFVLAQERSTNHEHSRGSTRSMV